MESFKQAVCAELGPGGWLEGDALGGRLVDWDGRYCGEALGLMRPGSTAMAASVVRHARAHGVSLVPQGGNTGRCAGAIPMGESRGAVLLSLERMSAIEDIDAVNLTATVEAGCVLERLHRAVALEGLRFPIELGAKGSCTLGGNVATNAGGIGALRYGSMRDQVLGLEVVLPDGTVWDGLRALRKDNRGYGLRDVFVGSEGTLGLVTRVVVKLWPAPASSASALLGLPGLEAAPRVLRRLQALVGDGLSACELIPALGWEAVSAAFGFGAPLSSVPAWSVLVRVEGAEGTEGTESLLESALSVCQSEGLIAEAVVAHASGQAEALWQFRELHLVEAQRTLGASVKHDVAVPVSALPGFITEAQSTIQGICAGARPYIFGHLGDGNMHLNVTRPEGMEDDEFYTYEKALQDAVHTLVLRSGGTFSAEHGIGRTKREAFLRYGDAVELALMRQWKTFLDPEGLWSPGVMWG